MLESRSQPSRQPSRLVLGQSRIDRLRRRLLQHNFGDILQRLSKRHAHLIFYLPLQEIEEVLALNGNKS